MPLTNRRPFDALGGVPGEHLGLAWTATAPADVDDVVALSRRCEEVDGALVRMPLAVVERTLTAAPSMVGRDRSGTVRACAGVRSEDGRVAVRALVDPTWRGRGVGRAILAWQDRWAREFLGSLAPTTVGVPIAAHLVDRRRLYTAAGYSSHARIELLVHHLGGRDVPPPPPAGWTIRPLRPGDDGPLGRAGADPHLFLAAGMSAAELAGTCEPAVSLVAEGAGAARAAVLVHRAADPAGHAVGWSRALLADAATAPFRELLRATLDAARNSGLRALYIFTTPAVSGTWREVLLDLGCEPAGVELLYTIETP